MSLISLFGEEFKSEVLSDDERLLNKIKYLELSPIDIEHIRNLPFEKPNGNFIDAKQSNLNPQIIDINDIKGTLRHAGDATNWYEYMDKYVNKLTTYESYSKNKISFHNKLIDPKQYDFPTLVKIENSYYIKESGDGNHRITIAKCIGASKVAAIIYEK